MVNDLADTPYLPNSFAAPSFDLPSGRQAVLDQSDKVARKELYPLAERMDAEEWWAEDAFPKIADAGFLRITILEEYGGVSLDLVSAGTLVQGFGRLNHALALSWVVLDDIFRNANEAQRRKYVPDMIPGRKIRALGRTEPGSDAMGSMRTTARREGGQRTQRLEDVHHERSGRRSTARLRQDRSGGRCQGNIGVSRRKGLPRLQGRAEAPQNELPRQPDSRTPLRGLYRIAENLLGKENGGVVVVMGGLDLEGAMIAQLRLGIAAEGLKISIDYAKARRQLSKPIGSFQMVQSMLADIDVSVETVRSFAYRVLAEGAK